MGFLTPYIAGWPTLLPTFLALGLLSIYHTRRPSEWWALQLTAIWLLPCTYTYFDGDLNRFLVTNSLRWVFMVGTILLATAGPGVLVVTLARHPKIRVRRLGEHVGVVALAAMAGVPVAGLIATWMLRAYYAAS